MIKEETSYIHERFGEVFVSERIEDPATNTVQILFTDGRCYRIDIEKNFKANVVEA